MCPLVVLWCVCRVLGQLAPGHQCARLVCCVCGVLGHLAPVNQCARSVCGVACAVSLATWLLFTGVLCVRCRWPLGSSSPVCTLAVFCCVCGVRGHLAPVHRCACLVYCVFGVLGHLAPVHRCARSVWRSALGVLGHFAPRHRCARSMCCVCGVLGHLAPVHQCADLFCCVACAVSLAAWRLFTGVHLWCVLCRVVRHVALFCVRCGSALHPSWSRALRTSSFVAVWLLRLVAVPWQLDLCRCCGRTTTATADQKA